MANAVYPKALEAFLKADIDMENDSIRVLVTDSADYTYSSAHDFLDDVPSGARVGTAVVLGSKTFTLGVFDAADPTLTGVTGDSVEQIILYQHTGTESTSRLICYLDRDGVDVAFSVTPDGGNILITWHASGIFSI